MKSLQLMFCHPDRGLQSERRDLRFAGSHGICHPERKAHVLCAPQSKDPYSPKSCGSKLRTHPLSDYTAYAMKRLTSLLLLIITYAVLATAQYTDRTAMADLGGPKEFAARRADLAAKLKTGYVLLFAKTQEPPAAHYREDDDFYYYTGLSDPGAIMLMDVATQRATIFEPQQSPREVQVYGANLLSMTKDQQKDLGSGRRAVIELGWRFELPVRQRRTE